MLGAMLGILPVLPIEAVEKALEDHLPERHKRLLPLNFQALRQGAEFAQKEIALLTVS
jgi:2-oxoglutarate ferredoxin oxidoreductase subunit gamma